MVKDYRLLFAATMIFRTKFPIMRVIYFFVTVMQIAYLIYRQILDSVVKEDFTPLNNILLECDII